MRTTRARWAAIVLAGLLALAGCGSSKTIESHVVSVDGFIGPLRIDRSGRGELIAYAGKPDADLRGRGDSFRYEVLGYGCPHHLPPQRDYLIDCRTAFYLVRGSLGLFYTRDPRYSAADGISIGLATTRAERRLHRRVEVGCGQFIWLHSRTARLTLDFAGGRTRKSHGSTRLLLSGGHVAAFYLHSHSRDPGVTDCA